MKKFLLSLIACVTVLGANAGEVVFDFTNPAGLNPAVQESDFEAVSGGSTYVINDKVFTNGNVTFVGTKGSTDARLWQGTKAYDLRLYKNGTMTIATTNGEKIVSIEVAGGTVNGVKHANTGEVAVAGGVASWTGEATSVTLTIDENAGTQKINTITVNTIAAGEIVVNAPTMSPLGGYFYNGIDAPVEVTLTNNSEGAKMFYQIDEEAAVEYTAPFQVAKTCTVKTWAELEGTKSSETEAYFTIQDIQDVASADEFIALPEQTVGRITSPVTVIYGSESKGEMYVTSGKKSLLVYSRNVVVAHKYKSGDVIPAGIAGTNTIYNSAVQMQYAIESTFADATPGTKPAPTAITIAEAIEDKANQHVIIYNATVSADGNQIVVDDASLNIFNRYSGDGVTIPNDNKTYAVEGFLTNYKGTMQLYPIAFTDMAGVEGVEASEVTVTPMVGAVEIRGFEGVATVYNAAGQAVAAANVVDGNSIALPAGFYIVKAGEKAVKVIVK